MKKWFMVIIAMILMAAAVHVYSSQANASSEVYQPSIDGAKRTIITRLVPNKGIMWTENGWFRAFRPIVI